MTFLLSLILSGFIGTPMFGGGINQAAPSHGDSYLAIRAPRGTLVRICAVRCVTMRSTDYGPKDHSKIADLALSKWRYVCDLPASRGVCEGTLEFVDDIALPATDTGPAPFAHPVYPRTIL